MNILYILKRWKTSIADNFYSKEEIIEQRDAEYLNRIRQKITDLGVNTDTVYPVEVSNLPNATQSAVDNLSMPFSYSLEGYEVVCNKPPKPPGAS